MALLILIGFLIWSLFLVDRTTLVVEAHTRYLSFDVSERGFFTLEIEDGRAFLPAGSPINPREVRTGISGLLDLRGAHTVELRSQHDGGDLILTFRGPTKASPPLVGTTEIAFDSPLRIGSDARRRIAVLSGEAKVTLGAPPQSNQAEYLLLEASARFEQYMVGIGAIPVLEEKMLRYKELTVLDPGSKAQRLVRVLVDLAEGPLKVSLEASGQRKDLTLGVRSRKGEAPLLVAPSFMDRMAANPLVGLGTAIIAFSLLFAQLIALFVPARRSDEK